MPSANNSKSPREQRVQLVIQSRLDAVQLLASMVEAICKSVEVSAPDRQMVGLCLVEAVNNAIIHAYQEDPVKTVSVEITLFPDKMVFDVVDSGRSAEPAQMNADHRSALARGGLPGSLAENGRGLAIMQEVMDSVEYTVRSGCNRLRLVKRLEKLADRSSGEL